jgi:hypothetical protein
MIEVMRQTNEGFLMFVYFCYFALDAPTPKYSNLAVYLLALYSNKSSTQKPLSISSGIQGY